jgi:glycerophosphoryl diester phosphodiesterase
MHYLVVQEEGRVGEFEVRKGEHGKLRVLNTEPYVVGLMASEEEEPDFSFRIECFKDDKMVGTCDWNMADMNEAKFMVETLPIKGSSGSANITLAICWVTPYVLNLTGEMELNYPPIFSIGHRGSGSNQVSKAFLENSMGAFEAAGCAGADFVEFDIQATKDGVPVVFHDLEGIVQSVPIENFAPAHEMKPDGSYRYAIRQFTEAEFKKTGYNTDYKSARVSFAEMLQTLPENLGFDIEIKFPSPAKFGKTIPYMNMNHLVDSVLDVMLRYGGERKMFFSSFDPFVVAMIRLKQRYWPVMQLMNIRKKWGLLQIMVDRVTSIAALHKVIGVSGFVFDSRALLQKQDLVKNLTDQGFLISTYGVPNNTREGIVEQLKLGVRGICTDDVKMCQDVLDDYRKSQEVGI